MYVKAEYVLDELVPIVAELVQNYTGCDSTSVTYEKAQQFMNAVIYCIREYESEENNSLSSNGISYAEAYRIGFKIVLHKIEQLRKMYNERITDFCAYENQCLHDTLIKGIPEFLLWYDAKYNPQDTILTLDYPILKDISHLSGIDAVLEYSRCIFLEQEFLSRFENRNVITILSEYSSEYRDMIENITSIVLQNIMGHLILNKQLKQYGFTKEEYEKIKNKFLNKETSEIKSDIIQGVELMVDRLYEGNFELKKYLCLDADNLAVRIKLAVETDTLQNLFQV